MKIIRNRSFDIQGDWVVFILQRLSLVYTKRFVLAILFSYVVKLQTHRLFVHHCFIVSVLEENTCSL